MRRDRRSSLAANTNQAEPVFTKSAVVAASKHGPRCIHYRGKNGHQTDIETKKMTNKKLTSRPGNKENKMGRKRMRKREREREREQVMKAKQFEEIDK